MLLTDCIPVDGTGYACQPPGSSTWKPCQAGAQPTPTKSLQDILEDGTVMDGLPGSLCMFGAAGNKTNGCRGQGLCVPIPQSTLLNSANPVRLHLHALKHLKWSSALSTNSCQLGFMSLAA